MSSDFAIIRVDGSLLTPEELASITHSPVTTVRSDMDLLVRSGRATYQAVLRLADIAERVADVLERSVATAREAASARLLTPSPEHFRLSAWHDQVRVADFLVGGSDLRQQAMLVARLRLFLSEWCEDDLSVTPSLDIERGSGSGLLLRRDRRAVLDHAVAARLPEVRSLLLSRLPGDFVGSLALEEEPVAQLQRDVNEMDGILLYRNVIPLMVWLENAADRTRLTARPAAEYFAQLSGQVALTVSRWTKERTWDTTRRR